MVTELTMLTSNSYMEIMQLPMLVFGMMYRHAMKIKEDDRNKLLVDLCDVTGVAYGGHAYQKAIQGYFKARMMDEKQREKLLHPRRFDAEDKNQSATAASILASAFKQKGKLMGV